MSQCTNLDVQIRMAAIEPMAAIPSLLLTETEIAACESRRASTLCPDSRAAKEVCIFLNQSHIKL